MGMTIWVDGWQMQCCGEPFRLGSQVAWTLRAADPDWLEAVLGAQQIVDAAEEHHGGVPEDTMPTRGTGRISQRFTAVTRPGPAASHEPSTRWRVPGFSRTSIRRTGGPLIAVTSDSLGTSYNSNPDRVM
jgi:hypothetical protein